MNTAAAAAWPGLLFLRPYAVRQTTATATAMATASTARTAYVRLYQTVCSLRRRPAPPPRPQAVRVRTASHGTARLSSQAGAGAAPIPGRRRAQKQRRAAAAAAAAAAGADASPETDASPDAEARRSLVALRIRELDAAGARVYPRYAPQAERLSVGAFRDAFGGGVAAVDDDGAAQPARRVELAGRVLSVHRLGAKLFFLRLLDEGAQVQVMCNLRGVQTQGGSEGSSEEAAAAAFKTAARLLQRGDHVAVTGRAVRTAAQGELTLAADALPRVYTPALAPLPAETTTTTTTMHRSVALLVQPGAAATLRLRARLLQTLRGFLEAQRFVEVQTPVLAARAGGATARPFVTRRGVSDDDGTHSEELSLRIAPELWLKRLVVGGLDRVYEIGPAFRNEGIDATHNPEFTMCEFYAAYWTLAWLMAETERLMGALAATAAAFRAEDAVARRTGRGGTGAGAGAGDALLPSPVDVAAPFARVAFVPGLEAALGFALPDLDAPDAYAQLRARLGQDGGEDDDGDLPALLDRLAGQHLEAAGRPLFVTHHPACLSPLAKSFVCPQTGQRVAARAELFVGGRELANMYEEENDPAAQRGKLGTAAADEQHYLAALETGLPPTGGWGCGVERLVMLFSGQRRIAETLSFGTLRHVVGMQGMTARR